jgi:hypothetical protein
MIGRSSVENSQTQIIEGKIKIVNNSMEEEKDFIAFVPPLRDVLHESPSIIASEHLDTNWDKIVKPVEPQTKTQEEKILQAS